MIVVCGSLADPVTELVCARLESRSDAYRLVELAHFPERYRLAWRATGEGADGWIAGPDWRLDLGEITGVYVRFLGPQDRPAPPGEDAATAAALRGEADLGLMAMLEALACPVANRVSGGISNNSKPYQALLISRGSRLRAPPTLVTSDPACVRAFQAEHGELIYKSASGIRSIVRRLGPEQLERLEHLRDGPAHLQAFVPGRNIRVHTVGERVFATGINCEAVDYRYAHLDGEGARLEPTRLPPHIEAACLRLAEDLDLLFAGIDLKETPDGEFFCFEVNPCPGFLYYERQTGQPISAALAELLRGPRADPQRHAVQAAT
jgi:glutathione synthase/RimK-type ligase-like ATP-grasp enzyme